MLNPPLGALIEAVILQNDCFVYTIHDVKAFKITKRMRFHLQFCRGMWTVQGMFGYPRLQIPSYQEGASTQSETLHVIDASHLDRKLEKMLSSHDDGEE